MSSATPGPAESALAEVLREAGVEVTGVVLASRRSRADVCFEVADADGVTDRIAALPAVESVEVFGPRVFVRLALPFLADAVLDAVEDAGRGYGCLPAGAHEPVLVTFSDPNTNKPLHVGHLRNLFLGDALAGLCEARGHAVRREGTMGDWGVHMCQALQGYLESGEEHTPEAEGTKGDHFVGRFYAGYHAARRDREDEDGEAQALLLRLEAGDPLLEVHRRLVDWATSGIRATYERVGLRLDGVFSETEHLDAARAAIAAGLDRGVLRRRADGCVVFDDEEADVEVPLVRSDGTLLVYPQILGIDCVRFAGRPERILSVFGHQWEAAALSYRNLTRRLGYAWGERYEPVFYAMVQLPSGAMRSREGRAVTADDAIDEVAAGLRERMPDADAEGLAVALLKYHLLRKPRTKALLFETDEVLRRSAPAFAELAGRAGLVPAPLGGERGEPEAERRTLLTLSRLSFDLQRAVDERDPAVFVRFLDDLVDTGRGAGGRLAEAVAGVVRTGLGLLGIAPLAAREEGRALCVSKP